MAITDEIVREQAREIILSHAKDVEYMSIGEMIADYDEFSSLPEDEFDRVQGRIDKQIRHATVIVLLSDEQPQDDGDVRAVRALTNAASRMLGTWAEANEAVRRELWTTLHDRADDVFDRFRERYAALDAKAVAALDARDAKAGEQR